MAATTNTPTLYGSVVRKKSGDWTAWRVQTTWKWTNIADGSPGEYTFEVVMPGDGWLDQTFWDDVYAKLQADASTYFSAHIEAENPVVVTYP